jgi:hypothetical protein
VVPVKPAPEARPVLREVALVFALSVGGCLAFVGLGHLVPFVRHNLHAFVAVLFLLLPAWALGRRGETLEDHGLHLSGAGRALAVVGLVMIVTYPPYVLGHHHYQGLVLHRPLQFAWSNYSAFPEECQQLPRTDAALTVTCERDEIRLAWRGPLVVEARGEGLAPAGASTRVPPDLVRFEGSGGVGAVRVPPGGEARISARRDGKPLSADEIEVGNRRASEQPVRLGRGWLWLLELFFAQIIAVALPEEVLYRGYMQDRLTAAFPRRRRILGAEVSLPAIFWTSVLFALTHFLIDPNPARLAVFFPSLLFGWIRAHTSTLAGCIAYHAMCNVLVRILVVHY